MRVAYDTIYHDLRKQIENANYGFGDLLPSQSQLVKRYGVAHNTVRKALAMLASEGYCQPIHGKGVRVIWHPSHDCTHFDVGGIETFAEAASRNGVSAHTQVKALEAITCDERLASLTGFSPGTELVHVERVRILNGSALIHDKSYFAAASVSDLTREQAEQSVYAYVEGELGTKIVTSKRTMTVERATDEDEAWLDLGGCGFLAVISAQTFDGDGALFEYTQSRYHPDHFCFHDTTTSRSRPHVI